MALWRRTVRFLRKPGRAVGRAFIGLSPCRPAPWPRLSRRATSPMTTIQQQVRTAEQHLAAVDPVMADVIAKHGPCGLAGKRRDPFHHLCSSIISQQLSSKAADTLKMRSEERRVGNVE